MARARRWLPFGLGALLTLAAAGEAAADNELPDVHQRLEAARRVRGSIFQPLPAEAFDAGSSFGFGNEEFKGVTWELQQALREKRKPQTLARVAALDAGEYWAESAAISAALARDQLALDCSGSRTDIRIAVLCNRAANDALAEWLDAWLSTLPQRKSKLADTDAGGMAVLSALECAGHPLKACPVTQYASCGASCDPGFVNGTESAARALRDFDAARPGASRTTLRALVAGLADARSRPVLLAFLDGDMSALLAGSGLNAESQRRLRLALLGQREQLARDEAELADRPWLVLAASVRFLAAAGDGKDQDATFVGPISIVPELAIRPVEQLRFALAPIDFGEYLHLWSERHDDDSLGKLIVSPSLSATYRFRDPRPFFLGAGVVGGIARVTESDRTFYAGVVVEGALELDVTPR